MGGIAGVKEGTLGWKVKLSLHLVIRSRVRLGLVKDYFFLYSFDPSKHITPSNMFDLLNELVLQQE